MKDGTQKSVKTLLQSLGRILQQRASQLVNYIKSIYYAQGVIRLNGHWRQSSYQVCKIKRQHGIVAYILVLLTKIMWALYKNVLSFCTTLFQSFYNQEVTEKTTSFGIKVISKVQLRYVPEQVTEPHVKQETEIIPQVIVLRIKLVISVIKDLI